jgi:hypothetical protein
MKRKKGTYYERNRNSVLKKVNQRYKLNKKYREAARKRARRKYHEDEKYRKLTIERAKKRYRRLLVNKKI